MTKAESDPAPRLLVAPVESNAETPEPQWVAVDQDTPAEFMTELETRLGSPLPPWFVADADGFGDWCPRRRTVAVLLEAAAAVRATGPLAAEWVAAEWTVAEPEDLG